MAIFNCYVSSPEGTYYVRGYPPKIWPYMVQYLHFRILEISH